MLIVDRDFYGDTRSPSYQFPLDACTPWTSPTVAEIPASVESLSIEGADDVPATPAMVGVNKRKRRRPSDQQSPPPGTKSTSRRRRKEERKNNFRRTIIINGDRRHPNLPSLFLSSDSWNIFFVT